MEKLQFLPGVFIRVARIGLSLFGDQSEAALKSKIENAVQVHATVMAALDCLANKEGGKALALSKDASVSTLIKIVNAVNSFDAQRLSEDQWVDYLQDFREELQKAGQLNLLTFIRDSRVRGLRRGNLVVGYEQRQAAEVAKGLLQGRLFEGRALQTFWLPEGARRLLSENALF